MDQAVHKTPKLTIFNRVLNIFFVIFVTMLAQNQAMASDSAQALIEQAVAEHKRYCKDDFDGQLAERETGWLTKTELKNGRTLYVVDVGSISCESPDGPSALYGLSTMITAILEYNGGARVVYSDSVGAYKVINTRTRRSLHVTYVGHDQFDVNLDK